jgi:hypothetical protein
MIQALGLMFLTITAFILFAAGCARLTHYVYRRTREQRGLTKSPNLRLVHDRKDN